MVPAPVEADMMTVPEVQTEAGRPAVGAAGNGLTVTVTGVRDDDTHPVVRFLA